MFFLKNNIAMQIKGKAWKWCFINCCCEMLLMIYKTLLSFQISNASIKSPPHPRFEFTWFLQSQARPPFMIYRVFTESIQAPFYDLQGFYIVKPGPLFRFTGFLQSQARPPFVIYRVFTESIQAPFYDLQGFHRVKPGPLL